VRRIVATLLVVASPLLMAVPASASDQAPPAGPAVIPAAPAVVAPGPVTATAPAAPAVTTVQAPAVAVPGAAAVPAPMAAHRAVKAIRAKAPSPAGVSDAAYAARLQAELCRARQIFCGLDHGGRYPAR